MESRSAQNTTEQIKLTAADEVDGDADAHLRKRNDGTFLFND